MTRPAATIPLVEDKDSLRTMLRLALEAQGHAVVEARDQPEAVQKMREDAPSAVLSDLRLPNGDGFGVLAAAKDLDPELPVIVMTAFGGIQDAVQAMKAGAMDFLAKPVDPDHLLLLVERALAQRRLLSEVTLLKEELAARRGAPTIIGEAACMRQVGQAVQRAAGTDTTVLLSDRAVARGRTPAVASYQGRKVVFYSSAVLKGGPGPDDPLAPVAVRQRILSEAADHRFGLTPVGEALKTGAPGAARASILTLASTMWMTGFAELRYSVETGKPGFEKALGMPVFDWFAQHPDFASLFSETMVGIHGGEPPAVAAAYDFASFKAIVDVGGATGSMLAEILKHHPTVRGILVDLPHVRSKTRRRSSRPRE